MLTRRLMLASLVAVPAVAVGRDVAAGRRHSRLHADDFRHGLAQWEIEAASDAHVVAGDAVLDIDTPSGLTLWFRPELHGPVAIGYEVRAVSAGGPNDAVSDVNAFWMASNADGGPVLDHRRDGRFEAYDDLKAYYVGIGGNRNTTTRMRRYVGRAGERPLLPEHDRSAKADMLQANRWFHLRLIAAGRRIAVERDSATLFSLDDARPYERGHFGLRTTQSHIQIRNFSIVRP